MSIRNIIRSISIAGLLCGIIFPVQAYELSDASKQKYLAWAKKIISEGAETALAAGPTGCGGYHWGKTRHEAKGKALKICKSYCKGATCKIIDVSLESDFIKKKGYSGSSTQTTTSSSNASMSDNDKRKYLAWLVKLAAGDAEGACWGGECVGVLAVAPSGCWAKHPHKKVEQAKVAALNKCKTKCNRTCFIKDVGGTSSFIKGQDSSSSTSTSSSSSGKIWCATKRSVSHVSQYTCEFYKGKSFTYKSQADAEHKRLKGQSTASNSGTNTYCHDPTHNLFYKKSGNVRCSGSDNKITQQEYSNRRLNSSSSSSTASSSGNIWCAHSGEPTYVSTWKCKSLTGKGFASRAQAQEYDKLNKAFEKLAGENMALHAVGRELVLEISELRQELERLRKKLED